MSMSSSRQEGGRGGDALRREGEILAHARHPGVVELVALRTVGETTEIETAVTEGLPLAQLALTVEEVAGVAANLATTVADLHDIVTVHLALAAIAVNVCN